MRRPDQLVHSRARVRQRYALMPLEGFPTSRLPAWNSTEARILCSPAIGANFVQTLLDIQPGGGSEWNAFAVADEHFYFVLSGELKITVNDLAHSLGPGGFAFVPSHTGCRVEASSTARVLEHRKRFEAAGPGGILLPEPIIGSERDVPADPWMNNPSSRLQLLIPDDLRYDMGMNIFTFDPGHGLPYVETHVMEHGLLMLEGKGLYYLNGEWMEVEKDDFIWMGPYCPQSFYATGPTAARYIYYKNVNRNVRLPDEPTPVI